jgi:hypothetical protein
MCRSLRRSWMAISTSCGSTNLGAEGFGAKGRPFLNSTKQCCHAVCMIKQDLAPAVPYSKFPFPGTRNEHTWGSRATKKSWVHVVEGETELSHSGDLELTMQGVYSFCPLKKEDWITLGRSWDCSNCRDGDSCGWVMTTISASTLGGRLLPTPGAESAVICRKVLDFWTCQL